MNRSYRILAACACLFGLATGSFARADGPQGPSRGLGYLDNGEIRLGVNLDAGGAIAWLSKSGSDDNVVNNWDYGRQIQMSYYSGPIPFISDGKEPKPHWRDLGWNPIQTGDDFLHGSPVLDYRNDGHELYVKCRPMQWPLDNVPGECTYECWISLEGPTAQVRSRINNDRSDHTQYPARRQELPAVYVNGPFCRLISYTGERPFTDGKLTRIEKRADEPGPWTSWRATECWSAAMRDDGFGLGVWHPGCIDFSGGFAGQLGVGGTHDDPTGYLCPGFEEIIDHNITHEYHYVLILGQLDEIRRYVVDHAARPAPPAYRFDRDRQHWRYVHAHDTGWPIRGELNVALDEDDPQLIGPAGFWQAEKAPKLVITAAYHTTQKTAEVYWSTFAEPKFSPDRRVQFPIIGDDQFHDYQVDLSADPHYRGAITGLRFDPVDSGKPGESVRIKSIGFPQ